MLGRYLLGYLPVQAAQGLVGFGSVAVFTRLMAPEDYGSYALALAAMSLTHILIFTWLEAAVARFHARAERRGRMREHLMTAYAVYALIALVAGTALIGLVQMLGNLDDPGAIGPSMAVALLTTFYGAVLANMVFTPLANKLERNSTDEAMVNQVYVLSTGSIGRQENPRRLEMLLNSILPPEKRVNYFD